MRAVTARPPSAVQISARSSNIRDPEVDKRRHRTAVDLAVGVICRDIAQEGQRLAHVRRLPPAKFDHEVRLLHVAARL